MCSPFPKIQINFGIRLHKNNSHWSGQDILAVLGIETVKKAFI